MSRYVLLDACVAAAYFAPKSTRSKKLRTRAQTLLNDMPTDVKFLVPNFCIAEVFAVFEKYYWGSKWNNHVTALHKLTRREFHSSRKEFGEAIHNGAKILQVDLNRYHILAVDLISPVNNAYKIKRNRRKNNNIRPAQTYDMLIVAMGIWLKHHFGGADFLIATGDERLADVIERAKSVKLGAGIKKYLTEVAQNLGLKYSPDLYPKVLDLSHGTKSQLSLMLPNWNWLA